MLRLTLWLCRLWWFMLRAAVSRSLQAVLSRLSELSCLPIFLLFLLLPRLFEVRGNSMNCFMWARRLALVPAVAEGRIDEEEAT